MSNHTSIIHTAIGNFEIIIQDQSLLSIKKSSTKNEHIEDDPTSRAVIAELREYCNGERLLFDIPLEAEGTVFQKAVWKALTKIPVGQTRTYAEVAAMIGKPAAARAVGNALNKNPHCIVVPCHRVTASNGLGGYAYGEKMKKWLLNHESNHASVNSGTDR